MIRLSGEILGYALSTKAEPLALKGVLACFDLLFRAVKELLSTEFCKVKGLFLIPRLLLFAL